MPGSRVGPDGTDGSEEGNTRVTTGVLVSEIVVSAGGARSVATVNAHVCPDERGAVTMHLKMTVGSATADDRVIEARATGTANDNADLTSPTVTVVTGKGADAKLLRRTGLAILHQAEQSWRNVELLLRSTDSVAMPSRRGHNEVRGGDGHGNEP